jgi:hypothetical protein
MNGKPGQNQGSPLSCLPGGAPHLLVPVSLHCLFRFAAQPVTGLPEAEIITSCSTVARKAREQQSPRAYRSGSATLPKRFKKQSTGHCRNSLKKILFRIEFYT